MKPLVLEIDNEKSLLHVSNDTGQVSLTSQEAAALIKFVHPDYPEILAMLAPLAGGMDRLEEVGAGAVVLALLQELAAHRSGSIH